MYFDSYANAWYNMLVCITTSNYPDIMLPAYQKNHTNVLFFVIYLIIGLFLIMNLVLAIFYSNFKNRFHEHIESNEERRSAYLYKLFKSFAGDKDYLTKDESFLFFCEIHNLITLK